ncbi:hypothetical protein DFH08DRAFT_801680 [Mycena albidolilacea]|uniref:Uncharacterized protein n=1 Tax=Mycena albidolilacea TaxID=1033008 RepID=A0AAD7AJ26_9AGAR|nr:hypothetical protein DFH08DRAFT_801680 [Mycena albidolilacea]
MPFPIGILLAALAKKGLWTLSLILMITPKPSPWPIQIDTKSLCLHLQRRTKFDHPIRPYNTVSSRVHLYSYPFSVGVSWDTSSDACGHGTSSATPPFRGSSKVGAETSLRDSRFHRGLADSGSSGSSSLLSSTESSTVILDVPVLHPTDAAVSNFDERCPWNYQDLAELDYTPTTAPRSKLRPKELLAHARYIRYLLGLGPFPKRASRVFPDLPRPADRDEMSVAVESESDSDSDSAEEESFGQIISPLKPFPPAPEPEWEEPAWCDFISVFARRSDFSLAG